MSLETAKKIHDPDLVPEKLGAGGALHFVQGKHEPDTEITEEEGRR
jgi:hypothetical protein